MQCSRDQVVYVANSELISSFNLPLADFTIMCAAIEYCSENASALSGPIIINAVDNASACMVESSITLTDTSS